jgi:hypothetical protein
VTHSQCGRQQFRGGNHVVCYGSRDTVDGEATSGVRAGRGESRPGDGRIRSGSRPPGQTTCSGGITRCRRPGWGFWEPGKGSPS